MAIAIPGYRFLNKVASGSSGTVYRAVQEDLGRVVAVKVLAPGLFGEQETLARFVREAKLQARLTHPNVVELYDAGVAGRSPYLVTEFVGGGSLRQLLEKEGALPLAEVLRIGSELAAGLAHAHQAGIVHRDLKPDNVLFTGERVAKLADFGLAKSRVGSQTVQTATGAILGTPGYLAPEVIQGFEAGPGSDLYALGVMLHEMASGERAFEGEDFATILQAQLRDDLPPLSRLRPGLPLELENLVLACTSRTADSRPRSAALVAERLSALEAQGAAEGASSAARGSRTLRLEPSGSGMAVPTADAGKRPSTGGAALVRPRERSTVVAGSGGSSARTVVAASSVAPKPARSRVAVAAALVALLGAGVVLWPRDEPTASVGPASLRPAISPAVRNLRVMRPVALARRLQPASSAASQVAWVSAAVDQLWVQLSSVSKAPTRVSWKDEVSGKSASAEIPPGTLRFPITGLEPGRNYRVGIGGRGRRSWNRTVRTLVPHGNQELLQLWEGPSTPVWFDAVSGESTVLGFRYCDRTAGEVWRLVCMVSPDDGKSWIQADRPVEPESISGGVAMAPVAGGVLAAWFGFVPGGSMRLETALLPSGSTSWTTGPCTAAGWDGHNEGLAVASLGGEEADLLACTAGAGPWPHAASWARVRPGDLSPVRLKPVFELPEHSWFRLGRAGRKLVAIVHQNASGDQPSRNFWTATDRPEQAPWPPLSLLTGPGDKAEWVDLSSAGDRVVVSYEDSVTGWARSLTEGAAEFGKPVPFGGTWQRMYSPATAAAGDRTSLAYITWEILGECHLDLLEGGLGPPWSLKRQFRLLHTAPNRLFLRAGRRALHAFVTDNRGRLLAAALPR